MPGPGADRRPGRGAVGPPRAPGSIADAGRGTRAVHPLGVNGVGVPCGARQPRALRLGQFGEQRLDDLRRRSPGRGSAKAPWGGRHLVLPSRSAPQCAYASNHPVRTHSVTPRIPERRPSPPGRATTVPCPPVCRSLLCPRRSGPDRKRQNRPEGHRQTAGTRRSPPGITWDSSRTPVRTVRTRAWPSKLPWTPTRSASGVPWCGSSSHCRRRWTTTSSRRPRLTRDGVPVLLFVDHVDCGAATMTVHQICRIASVPE